MDPLTLLVIILIVLLLFGGYGYRSGWHTDGVELSRALRRLSTP